MAPFCSWNSVLVSSWNPTGASNRHRQKRRPCGVHQPSCGQPSFCVRPSSRPPSSFQQQPYGHPSSRRPSSVQQPSSAQPCGPLLPSSDRLSSQGPSSCQRLSCGRRHASPMPVRVALLSFLRRSPVETPSRVVGCSRAVKPRPGRRSCVADCPAMLANAAHARKRDEPAGVYWRHRLRRICDPASDVDARSTVLHLDWSAVNGPSFC
jgi:hypothetical protein